MKHVAPLLGFLLALLGLSAPTLAQSPDAPSPTTAPTPLVRITGLVHEAVTGTPVPNVEVRIAGTTRQALTDPRGRFEIAGLTAGPITLETSRLGFANAQTSVDLSADAAVTIALDPAPIPLSAIVVTPGFFGVMNQTMAARQALTRDQILTAPQLGEDIFRSVARVPGWRPRTSRRPSACAAAGRTRCWSSSTVWSSTSPST